MNMIISVPGSKIFNKCSIIAMQLLNKVTNQPQDIKDFHASTDRLMYAYYSCTFLAIICNTTTIKIVNKYNDEVNMYVGVRTWGAGALQHHFAEAPLGIVLIIGQ